MTIKRLKNILWSTAGVFTAAGLILIIWAASGPSLPNLDQETARRNLAGSSVGTSVNSVDVQELEQLALIDLQRPLRDAPPAQLAAAKVIPPLDIRLTGTIVEPGHSRAMIELADGTVQLKGVGDVAGDARITEIQQGSIRVEYFGQTQVLAVVKESGN
jgi:hypothetical protein